MRRGLCRDLFVIAEAADFASRRGVFHVSCKHEKGARSCGPYSVPDVLFLYRPREKTVF
jgi:hypothetical protein